MTFKKYNKGNIGIWVAVIVIIILIIGFWWFNQKGSTTTTDDEFVNEKSPEETGTQTHYIYVAELSDVTGGQPARGVLIDDGSTNPPRGGAVIANYVGEKYVLGAAFYLSEPQGSDFYEGWVV